MALETVSAHVGSMAPDLDLQITLEDVIAEEGKGVDRWTIRAIHTSGQETR